MPNSQDKILPFMLLGMGGAFLSFGVFVLRLTGPEIDMMIDTWQNVAMPFLQSKGVPIPLINFLRVMDPRFLDPFFIVGGLMVLGGGWKLLKMLFVKSEPVDFLSEGVLNTKVSEITTFQKPKGFLGFFKEAKDMFYDVERIKKECLDLADQKKKGLITDEEFRQKVKLLSKHLKKT